jgi:hypothetical protein
MFVAAGATCSKGWVSRASPTGRVKGQIDARIVERLSRPDRPPYPQHPASDPRAAALPSRSLRTAARPRALSIRPMRRVALPAALRSRSRISRWPAVSVFGSTRKSGAVLDPSNPSRSAVPARVSSPLIRSACSAPSGRVSRQVIESIDPGARLIPGCHGVLKVQDCNVGAGLRSLRKAFWTGCRCEQPGNCFHPLYES